METTMDENFIYLIKTIVVLIMAYYWIKGMTRAIRLRQFYRTLKNAKSVSNDVKKGDYISFSGELALPALKTPIEKQACGYWGLIVRAVFQTKVKSPGKGMQTHKPVIYKSESDNLPLLVSNKTKLVQLVVDNPMHYMVNMNLKTIDTTSVPLEEAKPFLNPKYRSFEFDEFWLPEKANLHLWAVVADSNKNCVSVTTGNNHKIPTLVFLGDKKNLYTKFTTRIYILSLLILWTSMVIYGFISLDSQSVDLMIMLVLVLFSVVISFFLHRYGKIYFVR